MVEAITVGDGDGATSEAKATLGAARGIGVGADAGKAEKQEERVTCRRVETKPRMKMLYPRTAASPQYNTGENVFQKPEELAEMKGLFEEGMTLHEVEAAGAGKWSYNTVKAVRKRLQIMGALPGLKKLAAGKMRALCDGMLDAMEERMEEMPVEAMPGAVKILTEKALVLEGEAGSITETRVAGERKFTLAGLDERLARMRKVEEIDTVEISEVVEA